MKRLLPILALLLLATCASQTPLPGPAPDPQPPPTECDPEDVPEPGLETRTATYGDGRIRERQQVRIEDGYEIPHGKYEEFWANGKLHAEGTFRDGRKHGRWLYWYADGTREAEQNFKEDQLHGAWKLYRMDGTREESGQWQDGVMHGNWIEYSLKGAPIVSSEFARGTLVRRSWSRELQPWIERYGQGRIALKGTFRFGPNGDRIREGVFEEFDSKGEKLSEGPYEGSARHGLWKFWKGGALRSTGPYVDDALHGPWTWYHRDGKTSCTGAYDGGKKQGAWAWFHGDGWKTRGGNYRTDRRVGPWEWFHSEKVKKCSGDYQASGGVSIRNGQWEWRHRNGATAQRGSYEQGSPVGPWKLWHDNGQLMLEGEVGIGPGNPTRFSNRPLGTWTAWHRNGKVLLQGAYVDGRPKGVWRLSYENSQTAVEGKFAGGLPQGLWRVWDVEAIPVRWAWFDAGIEVFPPDAAGDANATEERRDRNGLLLERWSVIRTPAGRVHRHGLFERWSPSGALILRGEYLRGNAEGIWERWTTEGRNHEATRFKNAVRVTAWHPVPDNDRPPENAFTASQNGWSEVLKFADGSVRAKGWIGGVGFRRGPWEFFDASGRRVASGRYTEKAIPPAPVFPPLHGGWSEYFFGTLERITPHHSPLKSELKEGVWNYLDAEAGKYFTREHTPENQRGVDLRVKD